MLLGQLHFFSVSTSLFNSFLLFPSMIVFTLGMQLYEIFTVFRLMIVWSLLVAGKQLSSIFKNLLPMLVFTADACLSIVWGIIPNNVIPNHVRFPGSIFRFRSRFFIVQFSAFW